MLWLSANSSLTEIPLNQNLVLSYSHNKNAEAVIQNCS